MISQVVDEPVAVFSSYFFILQTPSPLTLLPT